MPSSTVQREVTDALETITGFTFSRPPEIDGCSAPTHAIPLRALAHGFACMGVGHGLGFERAKAVRQLFDACMNNPDYVGGTGRYDSLIMAGGGGKVFAKVGADGVYCGVLPQLGLGIALKCQDGSIPAAEIAFGCAVAAFHGEVMENQIQRPIFNAAGTKVGGMRQSCDAYKGVKYYLICSCENNASNS